MNKQISKGAIVSYFAIFFNIISGIFYTPWMIHTIGDSEYALYTLAMSVINIFVVDFGLGAATSRFLSIYYAEGREEEANNFLGMTLKLYLAIDTIIFMVLLVLLFFLEIIYVKLSAEELEIFRNLYVIVAFYTIISFPILNFNGILMAKEQFVAVKLCGLFNKIITTILIIIALLYGGNVYALVFINAIVNVLFGVVKWLLIKNNRVKFNIRYRNRELEKELFNFSVWTTIVEVMQRCIFSIAPTFLARFVNSTEIVYFSLASLIEGYVWLVGDAINGMFLPKVAKLDTENNSQIHILNLMIKVGKFQLFVIGMIVVVFILICDDFVYLWMGKDYEKVSICASMIIIPLLLDVPQQIGKTTVMIKDKIKEQAIVYMVMAVTYIFLAMILTPYYGVIGTSLAVMLAYFVRSVLLSMLYHNILKLNMKIFYKKLYIRWLMTAGSSFILGYILLQNILYDGIFGFLVKGFVCVLIYVMLSWGIFFTNAEKNVLLKLLKEKLKC